MQQSRAYSTRAGADSLTRVSCTPARVVSTRSGLTLIEMLLAAVILAASLAVLAQQTHTATSAALRSQLETEAALRCQSQLSLLLTGNESQSNSADRPFDDDPRWHWSSTIGPSEFDGLSTVSVHVYQEGRYRNVASYSLTRLYSSRKTPFISSSSGLKP
jgi:type II secretory pathway pseudopilin PulG